MPSNASPALTETREPQTLQLECPVHTCDSSVARLVVRSATIATFRCVSCLFTWSVPIADLPEVARARLHALPLL